MAKYFTRQIVEIDVTAEEKAPELIQAADEYRAKVSVLNRFRDSFQGKGQDLTTADVDYISGATVSANAICTAVNAATACVAAYQG